jgi:glycosyltransferase involved in cell wall biosynthesis
MARILYISLGSPIPTTNGHRMRSRSLLQALKAQGHRVVMICCVEEGEVEGCPPELAALVEKIVFVRLSSGKGFDSYYGRLVALFGGQPYGVWRFKQEKIQAAINRSIAEDHFDALYCDDIYMYSNIAENIDIPVLLNKDDITFEIVEQYEKSARWPVSAYAAIEARRVREFEVSTCNRAKTVLACSERDRDALYDAGVKTHTVVLPNVIEVERYHRPNNAEEAATLLYVGAMDWYPNIDGVRFFAAEILPRIVSQIPDVKFVVAGRNPSQELIAELTVDKHIEFTGTVADIVPYLSSATVCVVPLRIGSGTRLKIIEAAAAGKAVVSTVLGADGLSFTNRDEILREDHPAAFADAVVSLLQDPVRRKEMGTKARARAEAEYSISALNEILAASFAEIGIGTGAPVSAGK